jgi:hypothetical protein
VNVRETRAYNEERNGYDVEGPCWECGSPIRYFVDEDGTPRDITPIPAAATEEREEDVTRRNRSYRAFLYGSRYPSRD